MTARQQDLFAARDREVSATDIALLVSILSGRGWTKADRLSQLVIEHGLKWNDRKIRSVAHASKGHIISGQKGYKLTAEASPSKIQHASAWLRHQANEMNSRACEIDRVFNRKNFLPN